MKNCLIFFIGIILIKISITNGQISSKLDFDESKEDITTTPKATQNQNGKSSPKIQGVRVTVDTGKVKKSAESGSKESVEIVDTSKTKRVGIHTDITFEITDDKNDSNSTTSEQNDKDDTNASVPVFKGRNPTQNPPKKPHEPRIHTWVPSQTYRPTITGHRSHYNPNIPVFPRTDDESIYRSIDNWSNFVPITSMWTTERSYYPAPEYRSHFGSNGIVRNSQIQSQNDHKWKPCYCVSDNTNRNSWQNDRQYYRRSLNNGVDDKLKSPFS